MKRVQVQRQPGALQQRGRPRAWQRQWRRWTASEAALPAVPGEQRDVSCAAAEREEPLPEGKDRAGARLRGGQSAAQRQARPDQSHVRDELNVAEAPQTVPGFRVI